MAKIATLGLVLLLMINCGGYRVTVIGDAGEQLVNCCKNLDYTHLMCSTGIESKYDHRMTSVKCEP